ncbi:MAG: hypothetical protein CMK30_03025 [Porticoccaceae bacterium]|nr:hypothetical protein [Porticoccaceae bacterium]
MICFAHDAISRKIFIDGLFEKRELYSLKEFLDLKLKQMNTCFDLGANIGNHSLFFAQLFSKVVSFEPNPRTFKILALNTESSTNIEVVNAGLSDEAGTLRAFEHPLNVGATRIVENSKANIDFSVVTLDQYIIENPCESINFIKIDVEGHERSALRGASQTLKDHRPILALELHAKKDFQEAVRIMEFLQQLGYNYAYYLTINYLSPDISHFKKIPIDNFYKLPRKNHKMVLFTPETN